MPAADWGGFLKQCFTDYQGDWVLHNARFDAHFLSQHLGVELPWDRVHDTLLAAHVVDPPGRHGLKHLATKLIHPGAAIGEKKLSEAMHKGKWDWATVPTGLPEYWQYAVLDTMLTAMLHEHYQHTLTEKTRPVYELERAVAPVLYKMERRGCLIDRGYCETKEQELQEYCVGVRAWAKDAYGISNLTANREVAYALAQDGVELTARTATGQPSMTAEVLQGIDHPLAQAVVNVRQATKIGGAYFQNFQRYAGPDNIIHPQVRQVAARTGRMSITDPALQTLPRGPIVRNAFRARPGHKLLSFDYKQIEMRLFAVFAAETAMIEAIEQFDAGNGPDLHTWVAQQVYREADVTKEQRGLAKNTGFCCVPTTTQALSKRGWLKWDEIRPDDELMGHEDSTLRWVQVEKVVHYEDAPLVRIGNKHWNTVTTPNHRWLADRRVDHGNAGRVTERCFTTTTEVKKEHRLLLSFPLTQADRSGLTPDEVRLLAWIITDGSVRWSQCTSGATSNCGGQKQGVEAVVAQSKKVGLDDLHELFKRLGITPKTYIKKDSGCSNFVIPPALVRKIWMLGKLTGRHSGIEALVLRMGSDQLTSFLEAGLLAEGHKPGASRWKFSQNIGEVLDAFVLATFLCGHRPSTGYTCLSYNGKTHHRFSVGLPHVTGSRIILTDEGRGPVWCPVTPSQTWVARDEEGNVFLTGNTVFGGGADKIAETAGVPILTAKDFLAMYLKTFPGIRTFQQAVNDTVKLRAKTEGAGYVHAPSGRYHPILEDEGAYKAVNYLIQGTAADVLKQKIVSLDNAGFGDNLMLLVHDECIFEFPEDEAAGYIPAITEVMEDLTSFPVPLRVDASDPGDRWGDLK